MSFILELFDTPDIPKVLSECKRVLKENGRICVVAMSMKSNDNLIMKFYKWFHERLPNIFDCRPIYVEKSFEDAGFRILETEDMKMWGLLVEIVLAKV